MKDEGNDPDAALRALTEQYGVRLAQAEPLLVGEVNLTHAIQGVLASRPNVLLGPDREPRALLRAEDLGEPLIRIEARHVVAVPPPLHDLVATSEVPGEPPKNRHARRAAAAMERQRRKTRFRP